MCVKVPTSSLINNRPIPEPYGLLFFSTMRKIVTLALLSALSINHAAANESITRTSARLPQADQLRFGSSSIQKQTTPLSAPQLSTEETSASTAEAKPAVTQQRPLPEPVKQGLSREMINQKLDEMRQAQLRGTTSNAWHAPMVLAEEGELPTFRYLDLLSGGLVDNKNGISTLITPNIPLASQLGFARNLISTAELVQYVGGGKEFRHKLFDLELDEIVSETHGEEYDVSHFSKCGLTFDETTEQLFGSFSNNDGSVLCKEALRYNIGTRDLQTGFAIPGPAMNEGLWAMAANRQGEVYAITESYKFVKVDKETGDFYEIAQIEDESFVLKDIGFPAAAIDPWSGDMYVGYFDNDTFSACFYHINTLTGDVTLVLSQMFCWNYGLDIPMPQGKEMHPERVTNLTVEQATETGECSISFTLPTTTIGGESLTGALTAHLLIDGVAQELQEAEAGATISYQVPTASGWHSVEAYAVQGELNGPVAKTTIGLGEDTPNIVHDLTAEKTADRNIHISWTAPTQGKHQGWFDASKVVYDVVRNTDQAIVASGITSTELDDSFEPNEIEVVSYTVTPRIGEASGQSASSNFVAYGEAFQAPKLFDLESYDEFTALFTVVNTADDDAYWFWNNHQVWFNYEPYYFYPVGEDYLILPAFELKAGREYAISPLLIGINDYDVLVGKTNNPAQMTKVNEQPVFVSSEKSIYDQISKHTTFSVEEDGLYYIAIYARTVLILTFFNIQSIAVDGGAEPLAPAKMQALEAVAGPLGEKSLTLKFVTPATTVNGQSLQSISKVEILRYGEVIATLDDVLPNTEYTYVDDNPAENRSNSYQVVAYNEVGRGDATLFADAYVGLDRPGEPIDFKMTWQNGLPFVSWQQTSQHGGYIGEVESRVHCSILGINGYKNLYNDTYFTTEFLDENYNYPEESSVIQYTITGQYTEFLGNGNRYPTIWYPMGPGAELPLLFNGAEGELLYYGGKTGFNRGSGLSADDNNQCYVFGLSEVDSLSIINLPKISLQNAQNPEISFSLISAAGTPDFVEVQLTLDSLLNEETFVTLGTFDFIQTEEIDWNRYHVSLADYIGHDVMIRFVAHSVTHMYNIMLDYISVKEHHEYELVMKSFETTVKSVKVGESLPFSITIENQGNLDATDFDINLCADGKVVASERIELLMSAQKYATKLNYIPTINDADSVSFYAEINYANDEVAENNSSSKIKVGIIKPLLPEVTDLKAALDGSTVTLSWTAPDLEETIAVVEDDFESYEPFIIENVGDWTMYDFGASAEGTYSFTRDPYPNMWSSMAFQVSDPSVIGLGAVFTPHSGQYVMAAMPDFDFENDDWLITPLLSGNAQTVRFYTYSVFMDTDQFEVYYSTTGKNVEDFIKIGETLTNPADEWTERSFELPEGTTYFAVRNISMDNYVFAIDDFTYEGKTAKTFAKLVGYNIYKNQECLNGAAVTETAYVDEDLQDATYYVTALYDLGESAPSEEVSVVATGIEQLHADPSVARIYDLNGRRMLEVPSQGIYINNGKVIHLTK